MMSILIFFMNNFNNGMGGTRRYEYAKQVHHYSEVIG